MGVEGKQRLLGRAVTPYAAGLSSSKDRGMREGCGPGMLATPATNWKWDMADAGLFIGWGEVVRGRETEAIEVFNESLAFYGRLEEEGAIDSFEPVFLEPHGGDLSGFILIRGDAEKLAALRVSDEFTQLSLRATLIVDGYGVVGADLAERLQRQMEYFIEQIGAFA